MNSPELAADFDGLAILLDVDGTILDIAATPQKVEVPTHLLQTLTALRHRTGGALAFVSGRPLSDLDRIFFPLKLPAIGGHGAELRAPGESRRERARLSPLAPSLKCELAAIAKIDSRIVVEDKDYSLALHYRLAPDKEQVIRKSAERICARAPDALELLPGKSMIEIKQAGFDKASAVRELMAYPPFSGRRPVFIGDDVTDQAVFSAMPEFGGIAISVGEHCAVAGYSFARPADVRRWLEELSQTDSLAVS